MCIIKRAASRWLQLAVGIFLVVSICVFVGVGIMIQYQDLAETYKMAEETTAFVQAECKKFDNYTRGSSARALQDLLDKADGLKKFISPQQLADPAFLQEFIYTEHVGGVVILDQDLQPIAQADMDHQNTLSLWTETTVKKNMQDILAHPEKTYVDHMTLNDVPYDMAATATDDGSRLILCYASTEKPASDPYELTIRSILTNNSFDKNPTLVITDGTQVLSTNSAIVDELGTTQYHQLASTIQWKDGAFTKFEYQHTTYYGLRRVYSSYYVYAVYAAEDIFTHRTAYLAFGFMAYLGVGIIILAIQRHYDKLSMNKMEKQLRIINAISTAYNSTFLLHTDNMTLEPIRLSGRLKAIFKKHRDPYDFLFAVCKTEVKADYYPTVMHFLDLDTMPERLKGKPFLGCEVKDCHDAWFSVMLVPQKFDGYGNIQALLITTRDITSVKQTEELSFKDKLTGLHNRNYMESRSKRFVRAGDLPVSLIMADCNYLKRTNDTLGHEYGDLLLQRVANVIQESVSPNDVAMRVGGDEFLILCTHCPNDQAHALVDRIRQKLSQRSDEHLTLSVSFGVSTVEGGEFSFDQAYEQADQEMYRDKQASRVQR